MSNVLGLEPLSNRQSWEKSLGEFLEIVVNANPDKVFVEIAGQQITYADFYRRCRAAAVMFRSLGIKGGDRVCMFLPNVPEVLYTWFGLALIGGITVTINTAYRRDEMAFILNNAEASALVAHDSLIDVATQAADIAACVRHRLIVGDNPPVAGWHSYSQLLADSRTCRVAGGFPYRHLHAAIHFRHHRQPQGRAGNAPDVRIGRPGIRPVDAGHAR